MRNKPMRLTQFLGPEYFGADLVPAKADIYGIELELEGRGIRTEAQRINELWEVHNDNSLRRRSPEDDALEYVLRRPLAKDKTQEALQLLFQHLNRPDVQVYDSYRTSTHVHVNMQMDTFLTLYNFITLCIVTDELLVSQNGDHRIGNNFCLRFIDAPAVIDTMVKSLQAHGNINNLGRDDRYGSVNFCSLFKFGSVEFRSLECTTDFARLDHWMSTIQAMKTASRTYANPAEIISEYSVRGPDRFLAKILGIQAVKYLRVKDWEGMLQRGMRLAQDFAYCSDWIPAEADAKKEQGKKSKRAAGEFFEGAQDFNPEPAPAPRNVRQFGDPTTGRTGRTTAIRDGTAIRDDIAAERGRLIQMARNAGLNDRQAEEFVQQHLRDAEARRAAEQGVPGAIGLAPGWGQRAGPAGVIPGGGAQAFNGQEWLRIDTVNLAPPLPADFDDDNDERDIL